MEDDDTTKPTDAAPITEPRRPDAPPTSRLGRLGRLAALSTRALPMATEAVRRAAFGKRRSEEEELEAQKRILENGVTDVPAGIVEFRDLLEEYSARQ